MKEIIEEPIGVDTEFESTSSIGINKLADILSKYKKQGATHVDFDFTQDSYSYITNMSLSAYLIRAETLQEGSARVAKETASAEESRRRLDTWEEESAKAQYLELKKRFGNEN